jgi:hypothetical protein
LAILENGEIFRREGIDGASTPVGDAHFELEQGRIRVKERFLSEDRGERQRKKPATKRETALHWDTGAVYPAGGRAVRVMEGQRRISP